MREMTLIQELGKMLYEHRVVSRYEDESILSLANHDCRIDVVKATREEWEVIAKYFDYLDGYGIDYLDDIGELNGNEPVVVWYHYDSEICAIHKVADLKKIFNRKIESLMCGIEEEEDDD